MLLLGDARRTVERERGAVPRKVGDRDEQVDGLARGDERRPFRTGLHRVERIEQQVREGLSAERRLEPARAHEARQFGADLVLRAFADGAVDDVAAPLHRPSGDRHRPEFGRRRQRPRVGIEQAVDVGVLQPQLGQRIERLAARDRTCEEDAVDSARARPGDDIGQHAQPHAALRRNGGQKLAVDAARAALRRALMKGARRRGEPPDLLGNAVHIDGEADAAVANQGEAQFLFPHCDGDSAV